MQKEMSYEELLKEQERINKLVAEGKATRAAAALKQVKALIAEFDFTEEQVFRNAGKSKKAKGEPSEAWPIWSSGAEKIHIKKGPPTAEILKLKAMAASKVVAGLSNDKRVKSWLKRNHPEAFDLLNKKQPKAA